MNEYMKTWLDGEMTSIFQYDTKNKENKNWYVNFKNLKGNIN